MDLLTSYACHHSDKKGGKEGYKNKRAEGHKKFKYFPKMLTSQDIGLQSCNAAMGKKESFHIFDAQQEKKPVAGKKLDIALRRSAPLVVM